MKSRYLWMVRRAYRALRHPQLRRRPWWNSFSRRLFERRLWKPCRDTVAGGLSIGLFFAMMPIPFQTVVAAIFAARTKMNIPFAVIACWVTNPLTMVPVWLFQERFGSWLRHQLGVPMPSFLAKGQIHFSMAQTDLNAASFILGFLATGVICALLAFPIVHLFSAILPHHLPRRREREVKPLPGVRSGNSLS